MRKINSYKKSVFDTLLPVIIIVVITGNIFAQEIVVSKDGKGDFLTIQEAINSIPANNAVIKNILIKNGIYKEKVFITKSFLNIAGENRDSTRIEFAQLRSEWRKKNKSDWGAGVINLDDATNLKFQNLTIYNNYGALYGNNDHQFAVRGADADRISFINCNLKSDGGDTFALWNKKRGKYYINNCYIEGYVDFVCPRGWCYISNTTFFQKSANASASIWHDGSENENAKLVIKNSRFEGVQDFKLGRYHRDAQFYLINSSYSPDMKDLPIYFRESDPPVEIKWGERCYYYNFNGDKGNFCWHKNNVTKEEASAITPEWTFSSAPEPWNPESENSKVAAGNDNPVKIKSSAEFQDTVLVLADNFINLHPDTAAYKDEAKSHNWNYEQGLVLEGFFRVWKYSDDERYFNYIKKNIDYYITEKGDIKTYKKKDYNLDNIAPGRQLLHLFEITNETKYRKAADLLIRQLEEHPRTSEGGFWHKKIYPGQMWLDGLYMAQPFYTYYASLFTRKEIYDDVIKQFRLIRKHLYDSETGLYYHGWDETKEQAWADGVKGTSPNFWGRSIGWFMMALVDVLDYFPKDHEGYNELIIILKDLSASIIKFRDEQSKLWFQVVDKQDSTGNYIEASASLMFIYSLARGANKGYIDKSYYKIAAESFDSVFSNLVTYDKQGNLYLNNVCAVAGLGGNPYRDGSYQYYINERKRINDFKGYGPFILAAVELSKTNQVQK